MLIFTPILAAMKLQDRLEKIYFFDFKISYTLFDNIKISFIDNVHVLVLYCVISFSAHVNANVRSG